MEIAQTLKGLRNVDVNERRSHTRGLLAIARVGCQRLYFSTWTPRR